MTDLLQRTRNVSTCLSDSSLAPSEKLRASLKAFAGLELTDLEHDVKRDVEADFAAINQILADYELESFDDYQKIEPDDLQEMLELVSKAVRHCEAGEADRMIAELADSTSSIPVSTILRIREHRELMIPRLIQVLEETVREAHEGTIAEGNAHFFAVFLLSEFRATESLPVILKAFTLPGEIPFELFGDMVTETLSGILAAFTDDQLHVLDRLLENQAANEYVRSAAANAFVCFVRDGTMSREDAVRHLQQHLRRSIELKDKPLATGIVPVLASLIASEAMEDISTAFQQGVVDPSMISMEGVESYLDDGDSGLHITLKHCPRTGIRDTIEELSSWHSFSGKAETPDEDEEYFPNAIMADYTVRPDLHGSPLSSTVSAAKKVGRNEPCPCGSGKKYKKCCGAPG